MHFFRDRPKLRFQRAPVFESIKAPLRSLRPYRAARFSWHFLSDPIFRRDHLLLWRRAGNLFQHRSITAVDRYPAIFAFVRDHLADRPEPRLLSFGCATGEEVFSLHRYMPAAFVKGMDINPGNIATCRAHHRTRGAGPSLVFAQGASASDEPAGTYDAVFCMAVFVRWQLKENRAVESCTPCLRFEDFNRTVAELAACVRPGGLLVLRHAMFRFADTPSASDFRPLLSLPVTEEFFPRFGPDNRRLPDQSSETVIFRKNTARPTGFSAPDNAGAAPPR